MEEILASLQNAAKIISASTLAATAFETAKGIMMLISFLLLGAIVYTTIRLNRVWRKIASDLAAAIDVAPDESSAGSTLFQKRFAGLFARLEENRDSEWKLAVIEGDKLLEEALTQAGFPGEGVGDALRQLDRTKLTRVNEAWQAHRLRNDIVHDPQKTVTAFEARAALENYAAVLRELGVIE